MQDTPLVVICLKICTFVVATTTQIHKMMCLYGCDLLENIYLCGSNNNLFSAPPVPLSVVICLKIYTFVVATTTARAIIRMQLCCDLLENIYLCGSNNNLVMYSCGSSPVVICLKIYTFVVATTTATVYDNAATSL